jgi:hypothetical protein
MANSPFVEMSNCAVPFVTPEAVKSYVTAKKAVPMPPPNPATFETAVAPKTPVARSPFAVELMVPAGAGPEQEAVVPP